MWTDDIRDEFIELFKEKSFTESGTLEIVGSSFIVNDFKIFGTISEDYANREHDWYISQSLNVNNIEGEVPKIWRDIADSKGFINSNYGFLALSSENGSQFYNAIKSLQNDKSSRQAIMVYTRPSIHVDAFVDGRRDFICTNTQQFILRNDMLNLIVNQRSCDAIYGFRYDMRWASYLLDEAIAILKNSYPNLVRGELILQTGSLHIYPRHFKLIEEYINENS